MSVQSIQLFEGDTVFGVWSFLIKNTADRELCITLSDVANDGNIVYTWFHPGGRLQEGSLYSTFLNIGQLLQRIVHHIPGEGFEEAIKEWSAD